MTFQNGQDLQFLNLLPALSIFQQVIKCGLVIVAPGEIFRTGAGLLNQIVADFSSTMRLDRLTLENITGRKRRSAQSAWFREHLGVEVPADHRGPILTEAAYEALLAKRLGLSSSAGDSTRPAVKLRSA
jgi:hypothetical protein